MNENEFRIVEQLYGVMIIIIRGFFLQALINTFISEEIMDSVDSFLDKIKRKIAKFIKSVL